jgi:hypothetical protein
MENAKNLLAHVQAALDIADTQDDHLIGAHLSVPLQILVERIRHGDLSDGSCVPKN